MEKDIMTWVSMFFLWLFVLIPFINNEQNVGTFISLFIMLGINTYAFVYKEDED